MGLFFWRFTMDVGCFYYLRDQYFIDFPDGGLMHNKEYDSGQMHDRPCFYAFRDNSSRLFWFIPISSKVDKYHTIYDRISARYGKCYTIVFGKVLGYEKAFLIQNMCPVSEKYIDKQYLDSLSHYPVRIDNRLEKEIRKKAKTVLAMERHGTKLLFPDVFKIEKRLLEEE